MICSPPALACYAVIVGKDASADGAVLLGHNEQNGGERIINLRVIPRIAHEPGSTVTLANGGQLPEVSETYSFIWSENPGLSFSDAYVNEWGVAVVSDGCPTREDSYQTLVARGQIVDGGISYMLRRLVVQRATTAREGVLLAGELLDQFGYSDSGRTLVIADPNEAWLLSIVRGKHWLAQRVPDNGVVLLPNVHIICEVDLEDTANFIGSPDIVEYAISRGWYDPNGGEPFSFRAAYNSWQGVDVRQSWGQRLVTGEPPDPALEQLPFAVIPEHPFTVQDVLAVLRDHQVGICNSATQEAAVFQLRSWLPPAIGCVYWRVFAEPCVGLMVPWYVGITETPQAYYKPVDVIEHLTLSYHFNPPAGTFSYDPELAWWHFKSFQDLVNQQFRSSAQDVRAAWDGFEASFLAQQPSVDARALELFAEAQMGARTYLTSYCAGLALQAIDLTDQMADALAAGTPLPTTVAAQPATEQPSAFVLSQNWPNPFNAATTIAYALPHAADVTLTVYAVTGQKLATLVSEHQSPGQHLVTWSGAHLASGLYTYRLNAGPAEVVRRMTLMK